VDRVKVNFKSEVSTDKIDLNNFYIPKCLDMIKPEHVISAIQSYYDGGTLKYGSCLPNAVPKGAVSYCELLPPPNKTKTKRKVVQA